MFENRTGSDMNGSSARSWVSRKYFRAPLCVGHSCKKSFLDRKKATSNIFWTGAARPGGGRTESPGLAGARPAELAAKSPEVVTPPAASAATAARREADAASAAAAVLVGSATSATADTCLGGRGPEELAADA